MTFPEFTPVVEQSYEKRDPSEFLPWMRCTETPHRPGKLLIVRPLQMIDDFRPLPEGADPNKWRGQLCIVDVACLDPIEPAFTELGEQLPGHPAGAQFRNNTIFLGHLNKAFRNYIGKTCLGTVFTMPSGYAKPAVHWRDLSQDANAVQRARSFSAAFPDFFVPVAAQFTEVQPQQQQRPPQAQTAPVSPAPGGWAQSPGDPWAQNGAQAVAPAQGHPNQGMSTIDQLRQEAQQRGAQGQQQSQDPPF